MSLGDCGRRWGDLALALGTFDGVHLGHQRLIRRLVEGARCRGLPAAVLTFEPHPLEVIRPGNGPRRLTLPEEKAALMAGLGVDLLLVMKFDRQLADTAPADFTRLVLEGMLRARAVYVGFNFTYGRAGRGTPADLLRWGQERGVAVEVLPPVRVGGQVVSSTAIRDAVAGGAVARARLMLGRPYVLTGPVVPAGAGGELPDSGAIGVALDPRRVIPAPGAYAVWVNGRLPGVAHFGSPPARRGDGPHLEVHLSRGRLPGYGEVLNVAFWRRLRGERAARLHG